METSKFQHPEHFSGIWFSLHVMALGAINNVLKDAFVHNVSLIINNLRCHKCRGHAKDYLERHPLSKYRKIYDEQKRDIGFFQWTYEFHNKVNARLGKYQPTFYEAYSYFANEQTAICFNCGHDSQADQKPTVSSVSHPDSFNPIASVNPVRSFNPISPVNPSHKTVRSLTPISPISSSHGQSSQTQSIHNQSMNAQFMHSQSMNNQPSQGQPSNSPPIPEIINLYRNHLVTPRPFHR